MANKKIDEDTYECPACGHRWSSQMGMADLSFDEEECCPMLFGLWRTNRGWRQLLKVKADWRNIQNINKQQVEQLFKLINLGFTHIQLSNGGNTIIFAPDGLNEDDWSICIKDGLLEAKLKEKDFCLFGLNFNELLSGLNIKQK